jgi:hypothetical protein
MKALTAKQRWAAIGVFAVLATAATFTFTGDPFGYLSVCDRCGASRRTTKWKLPLTEFTVFTRSVESETPLSRAVLTNGIVQSHTHHWLFGHGGGHGVKCAIGLPDGSTEPRDGVSVGFRAPTAQGRWAGALDLGCLVKCLSA